MVLSELCNLSRLPRSEFPKHHEEARELGGYFIVNGNERVLRMLIMARRNFVSFCFFFNFFSQLRLRGLRLKSVVLVLRNTL